MSDRRKFIYITNCTVANGNDILEMIETAKQITFRTFLKNVVHLNFQRLAQKLGYESTSSKGLTIKDDYHVTYWKSKFKGAPCYYFIHSAIEYVFVEPKKMGGTWPRKS